ncbi:division/cell wall cluster transcriptional repressor MraZ [Deinococcus malanensis]|uniref:division/cell wall cluster transcriptional repressor MraZ n=1 Tax=Deinococcus malanensis TaxID=1706855 RepID=UPI0036429C5E
MSKNSSKVFPHGRRITGVRALLYSGANKARLDNQSRVSVPQTLRAFAGLDSEVIVAGAPGRLELWNPARWEEAISAVQHTLPNPTFSPTLWRNNYDPT